MEIASGWSSALSSEANESSGVATERRIMTWEGALGPTWMGARSPAIRSKKNAGAKPVPVGLWSQLKSNGYVGLELGGPGEVVLVGHRQPPPAEGGECGG